MLLEEIEVVESEDCPLRLLLVPLVLERETVEVTDPLRVVLLPPLIMLVGVTVAVTVDVLVTVDVTLYVTVVGA